MTRGATLVGFLLSILAGMGFQYGLDRGAVHHRQSTSSSAEPSSAEPSLDYPTASFRDDDVAVPMSSDDAVWGSHDALVTIVAFSNFQCGYCKGAARTLDEVRKDYGPDKLRIVFKNAPPVKVTPTHVAAMTVRGLEGNAAFWKFHDHAFRAMRSQDDDHFIRWAEQSGVKRGAFKKAWRSQRYAAAVDRDRALAEKLGITTTPRFFINGVALRGAQTRNRFGREIDRQLEEAEALIKDGTPRAQIYATLTNRHYPKQ